jgi:hypothetical protein
MWMYAFGGLGFIAEWMDVGASEWEVRLLVAGGLLRVGADPPTEMEGRLKGCVYPSRKNIA